MTKSRLEKVLEYMVNGESELATEMLHEHLIETARDIYAELAEEDEMFEEELELDEEDEDLDESFHDEDESGDFVDDLDTMESELEAEEYFGEDEDEDDAAMDDLEGEMDIDSGDDMGDDLDGEMGDDEFGGEEGGNADLDSAMVNVEDAMEELRAAFADIMGDSGMDDEGMDDEVADEFDDMDIDSDEGEEGEDDDAPVMDKQFGEGATLTKKPVTMKGDEDGKKSVVKQNVPGISKEGKAVKFAGGADEKGGKAPAPKQMKVTGPQEQKGKMDKKVAAPSNKSEKVKSNLGN